tara:strand:+ start:157 stop:387 length:231 start_codon:yes stop_codon:yes gene_type:complete
MNNIYDKLKPKFKDALEESGAKYSTAKQLKYVLLSKLYWDALTIDEMRNFLTYTDSSSLEMSASDFMYGTKFLGDE